MGTSHVWLYNDCSVNIRLLKMHSNGSYRQNYEFLHTFSILASLWLQQAFGLQILRAWECSRRMLHVNDVVV